MVCLRCRGEKTGLRKEKRALGPMWKVLWIWDIMALAGAQEAPVYYGVVSILTGASEPLPVPARLWLLCWNNLG